MENIKKKEKNKIPKTSISNNSYEDFKKICLSYSHILSKLYLDSNLSVRNIFSKEDIFVINDIINEIITYSKELLNNDFINEAKEIIDIGNCIIDNYYCLCDKDLPLAIFKNTLRLKLYILEADFNLNFKYIKDYINSEKILKNIIGYQKYLQLSNFYIGSSFFYLGIIYFFTKRFEDAEKILKISQKFLTPIEFELNSENLLI